MEKPTQSFASLVNSDCDSFKGPSSAVSRLAHSCSCLHTTLLRPLTCHNLWSNPTPSLLASSIHNSTPIYSAISADSPTGHRSHTSQSSAVSVHISVCTEDKLEVDRNIMFKGNKFVEDKQSAETATMNTHNLTSLLSMNSNSALKFKIASEFPKAKRNALPSQTRLSASIQCIKPTNPIASPCPNEAGAGDVFGKEKSQQFAFAIPKKSNLKITLQQRNHQQSSSVDTVPPESSLENENQEVLTLCYPETRATKTSEASDRPQDFIGDWSRPFRLPLIKSRHDDLKAISGETLVKVIKGEFSDSIKDFLIVDCRYPYEYDGGHIVGSKNIYTKDGIYRTLLFDRCSSLQMGQDSIIVFHCEFSSARGPRLLRFLRAKDRELNEGSYPRLHYPEIYLLKGGYKAFYTQFKELCEPREYKPMLHEDHAKELKKYEAQGKLEYYRGNRKKSRKFKPSL